MPDRNQAKNALDNIIKKSRVHLYKPIQIAEILYHDRIYGDLDLLEVESYRTKSKQWRDEISRALLGRVCTSSAKFQDDLFNDTAIPPIILNELGKENRRTNGGVEAYIYSKFLGKHKQLSIALSYCQGSTKESFSLSDFISLFWNEPGLRRSIDKIYEIIVYALFSTLVDAMDLQVEVSIDESKFNILTEFDDFAEIVMRLDTANTVYRQDAKVFRVGVTNAADRGLDMYSNWGPAIQIKHLSLDIELAKDIVDGISSDKVVIVCKDAESDVIVSLLSQIGWKSHIQGIVTENNLICWYEKALRGKYSGEVGDKLLECLRNEIAEEFPSVHDVPAILKNRHYENVVLDDFWL